MRYFSCFTLGKLKKEHYLAKKQKGITEEEAELKSN
jgi:hypothetical protein